MSKITLMLTQGYADWEVAYISAAGRTYLGVDIATCSPDGMACQSMGGFQTIVDSSIDDVGTGATDVLVICGGTIWETLDAPDVRKHISRFLDSEKWVAGICGGTLALARAGVLDCRKHVSNSLQYLGENCVQYRAENHYIEKEGAVLDQCVITAPGNAPISFSAAVFTAADVDASSIKQFTSMFSLEHQ